MTELNQIYCDFKSKLELLVEADASVLLPKSNRLPTRLSGKKVSANVLWDMLNYAIDENKEAYLYEKKAVTSRLISNQGIPVSITTSLGDTLDIKINSIDFAAEAKELRQNALDMIDVIAHAEIIEHR